MKEKDVISRLLVLLSYFEGKQPVKLKKNLLSILAIILSKKGSDGIRSELVAKSGLSVLLKLLFDSTDYTILLKSTVCLRIMASSSSKIRSVVTDIGKGEKPLVDNLKLALALNKNNRPRLKTAPNLQPNLWKRSREEEDNDLLFELAWLIGVLSQDKS